MPSRLWRTVPIGGSTPAPSATPVGRADVVACLALILLCLAVFPSVFLGKVLVPADGIYFIDHAFEPYRPPSVTWPVNTVLVADQAYVMYAWRLFTVRSLAAGYFPLWNPYSACGQSFIGNDQSALFNPTSFLLNLWFPPAVGQTIFLILTLIGACLFTYGLTRSLGGLPAGAFVAAVTFAFGGFMFMWLGYPLAATAVWLPALLWATHRLARRPSMGRAVVVALIIGWQFTSGHLSTSVQMLAFWALFLVYEWFGHAREQSVRRRRLPALAALAVLLGVGLGLPQLLPLRESFGLSSMHTVGRSRWTSPDPAVNLRKALLGDGWFLRDIAAGEAALLLLPERHGNPAFGDYHGYPGYGNYPERSSYVGFLGLLALVAGLLRRPSPGYPRFFFWSALIVFGVLLHLPILNSVAYLPVLRYTGISRLRFIFTLCAAVAVGLSLPEWWARQGGGSGNARALVRPALVLTGAVAALAVHTALRLSPDWAILSAGDRVLRLAKLFAPAAVGLGVVGVLSAAARGRLAPSRTAFALLALALVDFGLFAARWHAPSSPSRVFPETPLVASARALAQGSRLTGPPDVFAPNAAMAYELRDVRVYDPLRSARFARLVETLTGAEPDRQWPPDEAVKGQAEPCQPLDRLTGAGVAWRWSASEGVQLERLPRPLPHAYLAPRVEAASDDQALARLAGGTDPWLTTFIEGPPTLPSAPAAPLRAVEVVSYEPQRVTVRARAERPGWLVLTDTCYPGWRATVNGREAPVFIADYAFRAVEVPAGESETAFAYEPASYRIGAFVGLMSLLACGALSTASVVRGRDGMGKGVQPPV